MLFLPHSKTLDFYSGHIKSSIVICDHLYKSATSSLKKAAGNFVKKKKKLLSLQFNSRSFVVPTTKAENQPHLQILATDLFEWLDIKVGPPTKLRKATI